MIINVRSLMVLATGVTLGLALSIGHGVLADREIRQSTLPLDRLAVFSEVFAKIKSDYVEPVEDDFLLEQAIRGMLSGLDPHSAYLDEAEFKEMQLGTTGEFGGLGIEVTMENGFVKVMAPIDDTPAQRAGVQAGDVIVRLDETAVKGLTLKDAVNIMRGKPGTKITLTIIREGTEKPLRITLTRAIIKVQSVKNRMLDDGFGYIRITQFQSRTGESLREALDELKKQSGGNLKGLVLDLRNNPGGVLQAAVSVADTFLENGLIVYTEGRSGEPQSKFSATPEDALKRAPLVVLVNGGSASASEIVAGALQDHHRAIIMGDKTFGKGSVQTILPLKNETALKLTTARYYTPSGRSIQAAGIDPDITLERVAISSLEDSEVKPLSEAALSGHLTNGKTEGSDTSQSEKAAPKGNVDASADYQLYEALNLLKGLYILQSQKQTI